MKLEHGSLFSGGGGFDLAAEIMGWRNNFHCEKEEIPQQLLKYYWPYATSYTDIRETDFSKWRNRIDVLTGGFPCQPYSQAGKRKGKEDERHLWPEMLRSIREIQPPWVVGENVRGFINWSKGLVLHEAQTNLEAEGYEVQSFLLPAVGTNAPHERYRTFIVAYSQHYRSLRKPQRIPQKTRCEGKERKEQNQKQQQIQHAYQPSGVRRSVTNAASLRSRKGNNQNKPKQPKRNKSNSISEKWPFTNANRFRQKGGGQKSKHLDKIWQEAEQQFKGLYQLSQWEEFPTQPPLCSGNDGLSTLLDGITFSKWRRESIKMYGNAVVPQMAIQLFKTIEQYEAQN